MRSAFWSSATRALLAGLDVLLIALVLIAVIVSVHDGTRAGSSAAAGAVVLIVYAIGRARVRSGRHDVLDTRGRWWPEGVWMLVLGLAWVGFLAVSGTALWLAFPLMLLQMHVLGPRAGLGAVTLTTLMAVGHGLWGGADGWASVGAVLGPVIGAGVAVGTVLGLEALARENAARLRTLAELAEAKEYLAAADRDRAVGAERERLAREIHDTLAQGFVSVELLLRAARGQMPDGAAADLVDQAGATARENLTEARRFVRALAPADLAETTLVGALRRQVEEMPIAAHLHVDGTPAPLPLPTEAALLRIAQSALANVRQHADAQAVHVSLGYGDESVTLDIVDDGVGFDPAAPVTSDGGYGLRAIASRVRELGGTLDVESTSSQPSGASIAVRLPVPDERSTP